MTEAPKIDHMHTTEPRVTATDVEKFVRENLIKAGGGSMCVDGRYPPGVDKGRIARPGGDGGDVMVLLALRDEGRLNLPESELTPEALTLRVMRAVNKEGREFTIHTDDHVGCAHLAKAADPQTAQPYGVKSEDMQRVIVFAEKRAQGGGRIRITRLPGPHAEQGVLVIDSENWTVNHSNGSTQFFVYDQKRDINYVEQLVPALNIPGLTAANFLRVAEKQRNATLNSVAKDPQGNPLPYFLVKVNLSGQPGVEIL